MNLLMHLLKDDANPCSSCQNKCCGPDQMFVFDTSSSEAVVDAQKLLALNPGRTTQWTEESDLVIVLNDFCAAFNVATGDCGIHEDLNQFPKVCADHASDSLGLCSFFG